MKKKLSRQDAIYSIALAGISAGLALLLVWLGVITNYTTIAFFVAASLAVVVPLTKKYYVSSIIAYAVSAGLSFVVTGNIISVIGYIIYFAPTAILTGVFCNLKLKLWLQLIIKLVFINIVLAILYFLFGSIIISQDVVEIKYWMVAVIGSICLILIDILVQVCYKQINILMGKVLRNNQPKESEKDIEEDEKEDPFDGTFEE